MRVSVTYDLRNPPAWRRPWPEFYRENLDHMRRMEDLGFERIWIQQHHFEESGYGPSFAALAGYLAARTRTVRIGSSITILPLHHPLLLAEEMALLDNLLDGRLDVGVGVGHRMKEFDILGIPSRQRPSRMEEGLEVMKLAWTQDRVTYEGRRFTIHDAHAQPKPVQKPHPPIWMAARTVAAAERAARLGCHLHPGTTDPEVMSAYVRALKDAGRDPADFHITVRLDATVTYEDPEKVWERFRPYSQYRWQFYDRVISEFGDTPLQTGTRVGLPADPDQYREREVIGDPETILRIAEELRKTWIWEGKRADEVVVRNTPPPGLPMKDYLGSYELFAKEVMPEIKRW